MTLNEFRHLAEVWGGDISRWPANIRAEAELLAVKQADAAAVLAEAKRFDRMLATAAPAVDDARAQAAIYGVVQKLAATNRRRGTRNWPTIRWLAPALGFACAATVGIYLGFAFPVLRGPEHSIAGNALVMILDGDVALHWVQ